MAYKGKGLDLDLLLQALDNLHGLVMSKGLLQEFAGIIYAALKYILLCLA